MAPNKTKIFGFYEVVMFNTGKSDILENVKIRIAKSEVD